MHGIELQRGIHHTGDIGGQQVELTQVRGGQRECATPCQCFEDRAAQRRAFGRIGARSEFVDEHQ